MQDRRKTPRSGSRLPRAAGHCSGWRVPAFPQLLALLRRQVAEALAQAFTLFRRQVLESLLRIPQSRALFRWQLAEPLEALPRAGLLFGAHATPGLHAIAHSLLLFRSQAVPSLGAAQQFLAALFRYGWPFVSQRCEQFLLPCREFRPFLREYR